MVDLHAHILPGLDDGARDVGEAVAMARIAAEDGVTAMVATPHMGGIYATKREDILRGVQALQAALEEEGVALSLLPGADVRIDYDLPEKVREGEVVTVADRGKYLLVEWSHDVIAPGMEDLVFRLRLAGVTPILTHPERHGAVQAQPEMLAPLVRAGCLTQLTASSLLGGFGRSAQRCAKTLLKGRLAHLVASDAHSAWGRRPGLSEARRQVEAMLGREEAAEMFDARPALVVAGELVSVPDPLEKAWAGKAARIWSWLRK